MSRSLTQESISRGQKAVCDPEIGLDLEQESLATSLVHSSIYSLVCWFIPR